jgi:hypothetical protein
LLAAAVVVVVEFLQVAELVQVAALELADF